MVYDALGRCMQRSLTGGPTTFYVLDGEKPILEYDAGGTLVGTNVYGKGIDEILERVAAGTVYYPQQNHEGSVTLLTNGSGTAIERYRYDAFGAPTIYTGGWVGRSATIYDNRFLFTGREYAATYRSTTNAAFNFYEYRARAYNPKLGRFMSEDPKLFDAGDYNLFRYCHNDPIDFTDPMGLEQNYAQTGAPVSGNHVASAIQGEDNSYNFIMGLMQRQFSSAISAGMAGYSAWSAWSAGQQFASFQMAAAARKANGSTQTAPDTWTGGNNFYRIQGYGLQKGWASEDASATTAIRQNLKAHLYGSGDDTEIGGGTFQNDAGRWGYSVIHSNRNNFYSCETPINIWGCQII